MQTKPIYPHKPIGSIKTLAKVLGLTEENLIKLANESDNYFFVAKQIEKPDKSIRYTYDVKKELKQIHEKICNSFLRKVNYPDYIQGSVKGKDYLSNCKIHTNKKIVIKEDISNFFPSISKKVIHQIWTSFFKFPNDVSELLSELVTFKGNLVQGAKPSSFLCNLVLWSRESMLVEEFYKKGYIYTRYIDDITICCAKNLSKKEQLYIIAKIYGMLKSIGVKPNRKKHNIMSNTVRQELHRVNLNTKKPTLPKKERNKIETAVFQLEQTYKTNIHIEQNKKLFDSTMGRVNMLKRIHPKKGQLLKERLQKLNK